MESGVENSNHRNLIAHDLAASLNAHDVSGVVERTEGDAALNSVHASLVNENRLCKFDAAVENTVTNGGNLAHGAYNAVFGRNELVENGFNSLCVGGHGKVCFKNRLAVNEGFMLDVTVDTYAFAKTDGVDALVLHVNELILQRGAAGVYNQNFHVSTLSSCNKVLIIVK